MDKIINIELSEEDFKDIVELLSNATATYSGSLLASLIEQKEMQEAEDQ